MAVEAARPVREGPARVKKSKPPEVLHPPSIPEFGAEGTSEVIGPGLDNCDLSMHPEVHTPPGDVNRPRERWGTNWRTDVYQIPFR
jgi:hypothetical protein